MTTWMKGYFNSPFFNARISKVGEYNVLQTQGITHNVWMPLMANKEVEPLKQHVIAASDTLHLALPEKFRAEIVNVLPYTSHRNAQASAKAAGNSLVTLKLIIVWEGMKLAIKGPTIACKTKHGLTTPNVGAKIPPYVLFRNGEWVASNYPYVLIENKDLSFKIIQDE